MPHPVYALTNYSCVILFNNIKLFKIFESSENWKILRNVIQSISVNKNKELFFFAYLLGIDILLWDLSIMTKNVYLIEFRYVR